MPNDQQKLETQPKLPEQPKPATQPNPQAAEANIQARLKDLTNVNRIVTNAIALITDVDIKGGHAGPVAEILGWLTGFSQSLTSQIKTLESTLPKKEEKKPVVPKVIEAPKVGASGTANSVKPVVETASVKPKA